MASDPSHDVGEAWRSLGKQLATYRKQSGYTQETLAGHPQFHYGRSTIANVETGRQRVSRSFWNRCDQLLDTGGSLAAEYDQAVGALTENHIGFMGQPGEVNDDTWDAGASPESSGALHRRTVLKSLSALAAASSTALISLEALRQGLTYSRTGGDDGWQIVFDGYGKAYYTTSPAERIAQLAADLSVVQEMLAVEQGARKVPLVRACSQLSVLMAMSLSAAGHTHLAPRWWVSAKAAAEQSGDVETMVLAGAWEVVDGLYAGHPISAIINRADETIALAKGRVTAAVAGVLAGRAQALALAGRTQEASDAARRVAQVTDQMPGHVVADVDSVFGWPEHRLRHTESFVYTHIGDARRAARAQDRALVLYPHSQARLRTQVELHRASSLVSTGHVADGLRFAAELLDRLPVEQHSASLYTVARHVAASVPATERNRAEFSELRERIPASAPLELRSS